MVAAVFMLDANKKSKVTVNFETSKLYKALSFSELIFTVDRKNFQELNPSEFCFSKVWHRGFTVLWFANQSNVPVFT